MKRRSFVLALAAGAVAPGALAQQPMKIGIIGSGRIGSTFGALWAKAGHEVMFSDRDPEAVKRAMEGAGPESKMRTRSGSVAEAVAFGDAILIAVPYGALPAIRDQVGDRLRGKVVIDPNNPVAARDGEMGAQAKEKGAGVSTAALLPGALIARSFNSWGYATMAREANRPAPRMALPVAADDALAMKIGLQLVNDAGFDAVNAGSLAASKAFDLGSSVSGRVMTAPELRQALNLKP
jgi:predicted dinucleotide-binding enzyme